MSDAVAPDERCAPSEPADAASVDAYTPSLRTAVPGPRSQAAAAALDAVECPAFADRRRKRAQPGESDAPIVLASGRGSTLTDLDDNRFVDLAAGFGAALLGHGPSPAHAAARAQIDVLVQGLGDMIPSDRKVALCTRLAALHRDPGARVLLGQSGADAVTVAIKTATLATGRAGLLAFEGAYHGLSYAPLAACGFRPSFREPFAAQLSEHVRFAPYPRNEAELGPALAQAEAALASGSIAAVLVEPVLGRGGVVVPPEGFFAGLRRLASKTDTLIVADEIWTGMGRAGAISLAQEEGLAPELICLGKGLGASFPISACVGAASVMDAWARGGEVVHTSTHSGAPFACAAALATLDAIAADDLAARAVRLGAEVRAALTEATRGLEGVIEVRGRGLIVGVELRDGRAGLAAHRRLLQRGWLTTVGGRSGEVVVLTPALTVPERALASFVLAFADVVRGAEA